MDRSSKICQFYREKNILITGATGFVGKLLIDKLLRVCGPKCLYLLIRPKKSVAPEVRLRQLFDSPVFDVLKASVPDYMDKLVLVPGDISENDLGLTDIDRQVLIDSIEVIFHGAATVRFDEALDIATKINVRGTKAVLQLSREMKNLKSVVHLSTAYSQCVYEETKEEFTESPVGSDNLIKLIECLKGHQVQELEKLILGKWPNTYVFTKNIAEDVIQSYGYGLPLAVFRPGMMVTTRDEPVPGWIDNLYGPIGYMVGYASGLVRVMRYDSRILTNIVPADMTVSCLLAVGYTVSLKKSHLEIPIYNFTSHKGNQLVMKDFVDNCKATMEKAPPGNCVWYCGSVIVQSALSYKLLRFLLHTIPALIVDIGLLIFNKKPIALKIYKKIHKFQDITSYFSLRTWNFHNDNVVSLWESLGEADKKLFNFDMAAIDWNTFLRNATNGLRLYIFQEKPDNIKYARRRFLVLWLLHRTIQAAFFGYSSWILWRIATFVSTLVFGSKIDFHLLANIGKLNIK